MAGGTAGYDNPNPMTRVSETCKRRIVRALNANKEPPKADLQYWYWFFEDWDELTNDMAKFGQPEPTWITEIVTTVMDENFQPPQRWMMYSEKQDPIVRSGRQSRLKRTAHAMSSPITRMKAPCPQPPVTTRYTMLSCTPLARQRSSTPKVEARAAMAEKLGLPSPDPRNGALAIPTDGEVCTGTRASDPIPRRVVFTTISERGIVNAIYNWTSRGEPLNPTFGKNSAVTSGPNDEYEDLDEDEVRRKVWKAVSAKTQIFEMLGWTDPDDLKDNKTLFLEADSADGRLDECHFYCDPFRLSRNTTPIGIALLKVDRTLLNMFRNWPLIMSRRKLINETLTQLDEFNQSHPKPDGYGRRVDELKIKLHVLVIEMTRMAERTKDETMVSFVRDRAAQFFNAEATMFTNTRQATALGLVASENRYGIHEVSPFRTGVSAGIYGQAFTPSEVATSESSSIQQTNYDSITTGRIITNGRNTDMTQHGIFQLKSSTMDEFHHSSGHFRQKRAAKALGLPNDGAWHRDLVGYTEDEPNDKELTDPEDV